MSPRREKQGEATPKSPSIEINTPPREFLSPITPHYDPEATHVRGELKILPMEEVMERYSCGYAGSTWDKWLSEARGDTRVKALMAELKDSGEEFFQDPIFLGYYPEEIDEETGEVDPEDHLVFNGMHRFAAYHLLGREWGYFSLGRNPGEDHSLLIEVEFTLGRSRDTMEVGEWDDAVDEIWDLASWRLGDDPSKPWVAIEGAFSDPKSEELLLVSSATEEELRESLPLLLSDVRERFSFLFPRDITVRLKRYERGDGEDEASSEVLLMELSRE